MTTPGNRPADGGRPEDRLEASYLRPAYRPRRRRNDVLVTGIVGFLVGAVSGLAVLGTVALISWLAAFVIGFVGWVPFMLAGMLAGGIIIAIAAVRRPE